ncbi:MAG: ATP-grasp domain-containing protein [Methanobrevibacter sp.]|uniref:ATP-grasp domain-containing protein n=1 Tax=Methanobrevibacter sp. TaxID=66852 RepID=UPI002E7875B9|nr:ATP-grasp domain-containing protein [Methanobrevibacter sp.]MEE0934406.1 ATP-grasp domain-containing protein [Methanobrevibacter sp.]
MTNENDSVLVFEYFTASGEKDKCIISEAEALVFALLDDLADIQKDLVINKSYENALEGFENVNPIFIEGDVVDWLADNASQFDKAIFISAENNNNLYNITKILEENNVKTYTSTAEACFISSDKYESYEALYNIVPQPRSFRFKIDPKGYWKRAIENLHEKWQAEDPLTNLKIIIKPLMGVDCEDIVVIENIEDLTLDLDKIFKPGSRVIVQEFIEGTDVSVSLLSDGKTAVPISLNEQFVQLKDDKGTYLGGKLPFENKYKDEAFEIAKKAVEAIDGLKGFVGVDLIINADEKDIYSVYLLEINSRFTTPYVGLKEVANFNIGKSIVDLIDGEINIDDIDVSLDGEVEFKKSGDNLEIRRI